jgi:hypothetical protein
MLEYVALAESPRALPDDLILVFQQPVGICLSRVIFGATLFYFPGNRGSKMMKIDV